ncbi:serine acetyltransferase [Polynucleobacter sp. Tro8-14-1]|nr:serine acetyltransferase [Polynucleobacter sp. Tro8-14-1]MBU3563627.1 serine acetyltransferase [Polynucleobacter sp. Tro8-14-1]
MGIFSPRFMPVFMCRLAHLFYIYHLGLLAKIISLINFFFFGIEIAVRCPIGPGLFFPHTQGTVIGAWEIGSNATIYQGVTLGAKELDFSYNESSRPSIGDGVTIGSGAKIMGNITVSNNARIGANAVVLIDIPSNALAAGVPAQVISRANPNATK